MIPLRSGIGFKQWSGDVTVSSIRRIASLCALTVALGVSATANADAIFNVTSLGDNFSLTKDDTGYTTAVTSGDGKSTYSFDKYPVNNTITLVPNQIPAWEDINYANEINFTALSNKFGSIPIMFFQHGSYSQPASEYLPPNDYPWAVDSSLSNMKSPALDFNIHGQVVGTFYDVDAKSSIYGSLNNAIAANLGIYLTSALYIDDMGDIIAAGIHGDSTTLASFDGKREYFLLTPAPEPSTLAFLMVGITALGIRSAHRRYRRLHAIV
jgi:hypothetical protein